MYKHRKHSRQVTSSYHVASQRIQERLRAFCLNINAVFNGEQEKSCEGGKNPSIRITVCHHLASLVLPYGDPRKAS